MLAVLIPISHLAPPLRLLRSRVELLAIPRHAFMVIFFALQ